MPHIPDVIEAKRSPEQAKDAAVESDAGQSGPMLDPIMPFLPDPETLLEQMGAHPADLEEWPELAEVIDHRATGDLGELTGMQSELSDLGDELAVAVIGASGAIGTAVTAMLEKDPAVERIYAFSRSGDVPVGRHIVAGRVDLAQERTVRRAAAAIAPNGPLHLVVVATGHAEEDDGGGHAEAWRDMDAMAMAYAYQVNVIGPAMLAKHFLPLMATNRKSVFAVLSDSSPAVHGGGAGNYAYRASKAALDALVTGLAEELPGQNKGPICVGLNPGSVDTRLSEPLRSSIGEARVITPAYAATRLLRLVNEVQAVDCGKVIEGF